MNLDTLKTYLQDRLKFLQQVADADKSEDCLSVLGQIHEIKATLYWIEDQEDQTKNTEPQTPHAPDLPQRTYADGLRDAYADVLTMLNAGIPNDQLKRIMEDQTKCN